MTIGSAIIAALLLCGAPPAVGADPAPTPDVHRGHLKELAGRFQLAIERWPAPSAPSVASEGLAEVNVIMGGRYVREDIVSETGGRAFFGLGITGYDEEKKKYISIWLDNMSSGIRVAEGTCDGSGKLFNWVAGGEKQRIVTRILDDGKRVREVYEKAADDTEYKALQITYTRR